jgi:putative effector of murein hydrolase
VLTGVVGAVSAKYLFTLIKVHDLSVRGFALGTLSHGIGAARAMSVHPEAGAYAAVGLGLQVLLGSFLIPLVVSWAK